MWWTGGVSSAIATCQQRKSVLVVLVEAPQDVMLKRRSNPESSQDLLSRVATSCMHSVTFSSPVVTQAVADSNAVCLKFPCDKSNADFVAFSEFFRTAGQTPMLYLISPLTGATMNHKEGFVSPAMLLDSLVSTTKTVSGRTITVSKQEPKQKSRTTRLLELAVAQEAQQEDQVADVTAVPTAQAESSNAPSVPVTRPQENPTPEASSSSSTAAVAAATSKTMKLPDATKSAARDEVRLQARLPDGEQTRKSFASSTRFLSVRSWLAEELASQPDSLMISCAFPRRVFDLSENPKMLSELGLVPSATLIVSLQGRSISMNPQGGPVSAVASGIASYATGALSVIGSFFRSFVGPPPNADAGDGGEEANNPNDGPTAMRLDRQRVHRADDDENLLSNGNSVQFGWNPDDVDEGQN